MSVTHQDIAEKLGISRTLVTQALHGTRSSAVSAATRSEVQMVARQMGYRPRNVTTFNIGFTASLESLSTVAPLVGGVEKTLREQGYRLSLVGVDETGGHDLSEVLSAKNVDGVLISEWHKGLVASHLPPQIPCVVVSDEDGIGAQFDVVAVDAALTLERIVNHLLERGHRRIALVTSGLKSRLYRRISEGAQRAVNRRDVAGASLQIVSGAMKDVPEQSLALMRQRKAPTAIIAADLWRATPVFHAIRAAGYRIPQDVSFVSYADSQQFTALRPAITTTDQFRPELAAKAVERLLQKIHQPETIARKTLIAGNVIERETVGPPRRAG